MSIEQIRGENVFREEVASQNSEIASIKSTRGLADLVEGQVNPTQTTILSQQVASLTAVAVKTTDVAVGFPSYETLSRPTVVGAGLVIFDSDLEKLILWNGSAWVNLDGTILA